MSIQADGFRGELSFTFQGGMADGHELPLDDLIKSLDGWHRYMQLTTGIIVTRRISPDIPEELPLRLRVRRIRPSSLTIDLVVVLAGLGLVTNIYGPDIRAFTVWLFTQMFRPYHDHVRTKPQHSNADDLADYLRRMADEENLAISSEVALVQTVKEIDSALNAATEPIGYSAESMVITRIEDEHAVPILTVGATERHILRQPLVTPEVLPSFTSRPAEIVFVQLNNQTGSGLIRFLAPSDLCDNKQHGCKVTDSAIRQPHNPYAEAFAAREATKVVVRQTTSKTYPWAIERPYTEGAPIISAEPVPDAGLFDVRP